MHEITKDSRILVILGTVAVGPFLNQDVAERWLETQDTSGKTCQMLSLHKGLSSETVTEDNFDTVNPQECGNILQTIDEMSESKGRLHKPHRAASGA